MLAVDIEAFGSLPNDDIRRRLRAGMREIVQEALKSSGLGVERTAEPEQLQAADLGDGVLYVINAEHTGDLVDCVARIKNRVRMFNEAASAQAKLRLRVVVHAGEVEYDEHGVTGADLIAAFRLLNSDKLHERLRELTDGDVVLVVSEYVLDHVVLQEQCDLFRVEDFDRVEVRVKELRAGAGVYPRLPEPQPQPQPVQQSVSWLVAVWNAVLRFVRRYRRVLLNGGVALTLVAALGLTVYPLLLEEIVDCPVPTELVVMASPSISDTLEAVAEAFVRDQGGLCRAANFEVFAVPTYAAAAEHVAAGWALESALPQFGPEPAVWIPDSTAVTHQPLRELRGRNLRYHAKGSIARSPVVLAANRAFMNRLTPEPSVTWEEIHSWLPLAEADDGPAVLVSRSSPTTSAAALLATMQLFGRADDANDREAIEAQLQAATADEPTELRDMGSPAGDSAAPPQALLTSERLMTTQNTGGTGNCASVPDDQKLTAVYPRDDQGRTPVLDYPYVLLPAAFEHEERKRLLDGFHDYLTTNDEAKSELRAAGFRNLDRNADRDAECGADQGRPDLPLDQPDHTSVRQTVSWWDAARPAAQVLLGIDVSQSMTQIVRGEDGNRLTAARAAAEQFADQTTGRDHLVLWKFADNFEDGLPYEEVGSIRAVQFPERGRGTKLYQTVEDGIKQLRGTGAPGDVRAMVVVTDGGEGLREGVGDEEMLRALNQRGETDVLIFLLVVGSTGCDAEELAPLDGLPAVECVEDDVGLPTAFAKLSAVLFGS